MRAVFMGTPDFSVPVLEAMVNAGHQIAGVVTQPDKPKGRGKAVAFSPVKEAALKYGLPIYQPVKVRDPEFVKVLRELAPEVIVVVAFGQILSREILELPRYGCVNVHASLLPMYRGASPIQHVILNGEKETGVTTMMMDTGIDTGDMLLKTVIPIDEKETGGSLHDKLAKAGGPLLIETLDQLSRGTAVRIPQEGETCYAGMLTKAMGRMDFTRSAEELERQVRGLYPWPGAYTSVNGKTLKVFRASVSDEESGREPGRVVQIAEKGFCVQTGKGLLQIEEVQLEGKKRMEAEAFLRGYSLDCDTKLGD